MSVLSVENLPDEARAAVKRVVDAMEMGKDRHEASRRKWERYYKLYRSYKELKRTHADSRGASVDAVIRDAMHGFGADLFIPYVFSTIETTLPRMLAQNPRMSIRPAVARSEDEFERLEGNIENMKLLMERQQDKASYNLVLQDVGKTALTYGVGFQKMLWQQTFRDGRVLQRPTVAEEGSPDWVIGGLGRDGSPSQKLAFEGPVAEWVDPFDFVWDPRGWHLNPVLGGCCRWVIHRLWLDDSEVKERVENGTWQLPPGVDLGELLSGGGTSARSEVRAERDAAAGMPSDQARTDKQHEVWEFHDGSEVITVMDACCPVMMGRNPHWHAELPFQVARPTRVPGEMNGIGEPEAIEDLNEEMNIMRAQRRDNAAIVLQRPFAYFEGLVDVADFEWGAGVGLGVEGNPADLLHFFPVQDIPHSSYQEESNLQRDIERVTGIDDTVAGGEGGGGASATATGVQMVQRAAGIRIHNKTKLVSDELVKPGCAQMLMLNQQKITSSFFIPGPPRPEEGPHRSWSWYAMGPDELAGDMEAEPVDGSMEPDNPTEALEKATRLWTSFAQDPYVDPMWLREQVLELYGVENPRSKLLDPAQQISPEEIELAAQGIAEDLGLDPAVLLPIIMQRVEEAQALAAEAGQEQGGPVPPGQQPQGEQPPQQ